MTVEVVAPDLISAVCGAEALGCYQPEAPGRSPRGYMWIPSVHEDLVHIIVHEYGHHVDNQLTNLAHLGFGGCDVSGDGSRNWFFTRDADDSLIDLGISCAPQNDWSHMLGELYAEDYTWLHGNRFWRPDMPVRAPGEWHLEAMASDMAAPFKRESRRLSRWVAATRVSRDPVEARPLDVLLGKAHGRRAADLDLYLRKANAGGRSRAAREPEAARTSSACWRRAGTRSRSSRPPKGAHANAAPVPRLAAGRADARH